MIWDELVIDEIAITVQAEALPPPPRPRFAPPEISDVVIEDELDLPEFDLFPDFDGFEAPQQAQQGRCRKPRPAGGVFAASLKPLPRSRPATSAFR